MAVNTSDTKQVGGKPVGKKTRPLSPKAAELVAERTTGNFPVFVRAPKTGVEFYSGLSRAKLYELAGAGKIVSRSIREPGQIRGCRLFLLQSVLDFLFACDEGKPQKSKMHETDAELAAKTK